MDFGFLAYLSWREVLVVAVVLLVLYILCAFLCINRLRDEARSARQRSQLSPDAIQSAVRSYATVQEQESPAVSDEAARVARAELPEPVKERARGEPSAERQERRRTEVLEQDVAQLRREIGGLRAELQALREEQQREMNQAQIVQNTSPFYNDAMHLATQGRDAADISVLCGISRAEAELVVALAKSQASG
jgi:biopolymer transport protein ExbB/TolQ